ncbi:MAG TPA: carboxypeptidase-like regulatory domain-containing protein, partial [Chitinophaga sp.]
MRLTAILTLVFTLNLSAKTFSQSITLKARHISLYEVFNHISRQTGYEFVYDAQLVKRATPVNIDVKQATIADVLNNCLAGAPSLTYTIVDKTIVISARPSPRAATVASAPVMTITGKVLDAQGKPLIGVAVQVKGTTRGLLTNEQGEFSIQANAGDVLVFSYLGYESQSVTVGAETTLT